MDPNFQYHSGIQLTKHVDVHLVLVLFPEVFHDRLPFGRDPAGYNIIHLYMVHIDLHVLFLYAIAAYFKFTARP